MNLLAKYANRKPYTEIKPTYLEDQYKELPEKFKIWESNDQNMLADFSDLDIVSFAKS